MIRWIKQHRKVLLLAGDGVLVLGWFVTKLLSEWLLTNTNTVCDWTRIGAECLTCGGTHFVNDFLSFRFVQAFHDHELMFITAVYLVISLVFVHLLVLFDLPFAKDALKRMYNIPVLIVYILGVAAFLILRNIPAILMLYHFFEYKLTQDGGLIALIELFFAKS